MDKTDTISLYDGSVTKIKYSYPDNAPVDKLVIFVNGSGQNTYDNKRRNPKGGFFNYHDYFRHEFLSRNVAYCSYNTRGVDIGDTEPLFICTNEDEYKKYTPLNSVKDIESIVEYLTGLPEFQNVKVYLLGWSEGTVIAPLVALSKKVKIDALLLAGYVNENMKDTMTWQLNGNSSYMNIKKYFDKDKKGFISREDFESADPKARKVLFGELTFDNIDANSDGRIDTSDFAVHQKPYLELLLDAIANNDDEFLKTKYINPVIRLTTGWFNQHFSLAPTKDILPQLDLPIFIFHGTDDNACPVKYALDIKDDFIKLEKTNLTVNIFEDHDHDLNFSEWLLQGIIPPGIACIFDTIDAR